MSEESNKRNGEGRGPSRTTWPPAWLAGGAGAVDGPDRSGTGPSVFIPSTLPLDLREAWDERVAIMHHDGGLPLSEAERLALADVLEIAGRTDEPRP